MRIKIAACLILTLGAGLFPRQMEAKTARVQMQSLKIKVTAPTTVVVNQIYTTTMVINNVSSNPESFMFHLAIVSPGWLNDNIHLSAVLTGSDGKSRSVLEKEPYNDLHDVSVTLGNATALPSNDWMKFTIQLYAGDIVGENMATIFTIEDSPWGAILARPGYHMWTHVATIAQTQPSM